MFMLLQMSPVLFVVVMLCLLCLYLLRISLSC